MPEREDEANRSLGEPEKAAMDRYLEYREQMLRYDREYVERLKRSQEAASPVSAPSDPLWDHPICDRCPNREGCGLQRAMREVERADVEAACARDTVELGTPPPPYPQMARDLAEQIDATEARCILALGTKPQRMLSDAQRVILDGAKTSSASSASATLTELLRMLREADAIARRARDTSGSKIPWFGAKTSGERKVVGAYASVAQAVKSIEAKLDRQQLALLDDYENLEAVFAENTICIERLAVYIAAGLMKLDELTAQLESPRSDSGTPANHEVQLLDDAHRAVDRLSRRVYDLELTRTIALQTGLQIRLIQDADERLATQIHTAVLTTIPLWEAQLSMSAVDIDSLQATTGELIATIEDALRVSAEGRAKRAEGEKLIAEAEERAESVHGGKRRETAIPGSENART